MKYFISRSLTVVFLLIITLFNGCKPEYKVETIVEFSKAEPVSASLNKVTGKRLTQRLTATYGDNLVVEAQENGFRIITAHRNQPIAAMAGLMGYFGSAEMGLYDVFSVNDPRLRPVLDSFPWPDYVEVPSPADSYRRHLIATTTNAARLDQLLEGLNEVLPPGLPVILRWSPPRDPAPGQGGLRTYDLYALKTAGNDGAPRIGNQGIEATKVESTQQGQIAVSVKMTPTATKIWAEMTAAAAADDNCPVAIVVNDEVVSSPSVMSSITGGMTQITGNFSVEEAEALAQQLKWKPLPAKLVIISQEVVE